MNLKANLRIEDLLSGALAVLLLSYAGVRSLLAGLAIDEEHYWEFALILLPATGLVFAVSLRYALRGNAEHAPAQVARIARDWFPFLLFMMVYETFQSRIWSVLSPHDRDDALLALDRRLFGETPALRLESITTPTLTDAMTIAYFLHLILPPILALACYLKDRELFREFLLAVLLGGAVASVGYLVVPAVGPGLAHAARFHLELHGRLYGPVTHLVDLARAPRDVFPSLHVGLSSIVLYYAARRGRAWFLVCLPLVLANWFSTVYLRYHYLIDVFAGWLLAILVVLGSRALLAFERKIGLGRGTAAVSVAATGRSVSRAII